MPFYSPNEAYTFMDLFHGKRSSYGVHIPGALETSGKRKGISKTIHELLDYDSYCKHLAGVRSIGVIPIAEDDLCYFGAIDVDDYSGKAVSIINTIYRLGVPLFPFRSKSGGLHLFIFFDKVSPPTATETIEILHNFRELLGLSVKTEIFPKQRAVMSNGTGSWINLPYFGDSDRALIAADGKSVPFAAAIQLMDRGRVSLASIERFFSSLPFADGPPCLQSIALLGATAYRNNYLFSAGRYCKSKYGDGFEAYLREVNSALIEPIPEKELDDTVLKSLRTSDATYKCKDVPICDLCNKMKCRSRKFGIGAGEVSDLSYGKMVQVMNDPPFYLWSVNGVEFKFFDETELISQLSFQKQCVRLLHYKPAQMSNPQWDKIVNGALAHCEKRGVDALTALDEGTSLRELIAEFLTKRTRAASMKEILAGRVYREEAGAKSRYLFKPAKLKEFLVDTKRYKTFSLPQIGDRLMGMGGAPVRIKIDEEHPAVAVWALPEEAIRDIMDNDAFKDIEVELDEIDEGAAY